MNAAQEIARLQSIAEASLRCRPRSPYNDRAGHMIHLYVDKKCSLRGVAEIVGCCLETVRQTLIRNGIQLRTPGANYTRYGH